MLKTIKEIVTVKAGKKSGGRIEIISDELKAGQIAEVIIMVQTPENPKKSLMEFFGAGKGCFENPEESDEFIRKERDTWEH